MTTNRIIDRSQLHFAKQVKDSFAFLESSGFRETRAEPTIVRYESPSLAINIYQGRQSYEIGLEIESLQVPKESYSFSQILRLVDVEGAENYRNFMTHTAEGVAEGVYQLAVLLRQCIDTGILSDKQLFSRLKRQRDEWGRKYEIEVKLRQAHNGVATAWAKKDFDKVVKILSPLQEHLSPADFKKLDYAKKQL